MARIALSLLAALGLLSSFTPPAEALSIATGSGTTSCTASSSPAKFSSFVTTEQIAVQTCSDAFAQFESDGSVSFETETIVRVSTVFAAAPMADVAVTATTFQNPAGLTRTLRSAGTARFAYEFDLDGFGPAGFSGQVPLSIRSPWEINRDQGASALVQVTLRDNRNPPQSDRQFVTRAENAPGGIIGGTFVIGIDLETSVVIGLIIESACSIDTAPQLGSVECQAVIDPVIEFDQARFDAQQGANTFNLASFYSINTSANLPEPGTGLLLGLCAMGGAALRRKTHLRTA